MSDIFAETYNPAPSTVKPDPEMVDLIGAHVWWPQLDLRSSKCACGWRGEDPEYPSVGHAAHVALVVEQHTNRRITELYEQRDNAIEAGLAAIDRAEKAEVTIARVQNALEGDCDSCDYTDLRAASEGKS
ncbi:hypothetical protein SEA_WHACK_60 [Rhodococcus phage Whack]|uniref:Uncharacterized protein n=1 Tax=Rhodococcus phage Whack TaxID=2591132 RepID=A0A515MKC5_9CAUD|nr:hypothetical protein HWC40_gp60 [Rhodococcus phage Whack]QDM57123.1 hypothetical protein SEA_WHACK_60 [Rhodococcus phage Whack]